MDNRTQDRYRPGSQPVPAAAPKAPLSIAGLRKPVNGFSKKILGIEDFSSSGPCEVLTGAVFWLYLSVTAKTGSFGTALRYTPQADLRREVLTWQIQKKKMSN